MELFRRVILNTVLLMLLSIAACNNNDSFEGSNNSIKIMTFNIRLNTPSDGINAWPNRASEVVSMIKFYDTDVVGTQEVLKEQKSYLDEKLDGFTSVGVGRNDGVEKGEFSAIYYRNTKFQLLNSGTFWLSETPEVIGSVGWDAALERISTWVELKDNNSGKTFFVFNTHFDHIGEQARINSAELILAKISDIAGASPVVLIGDFNVTSDNEAYKTITRKMHDAQFKSAQPHHGPTWTFNGFDSVAMAERNKIDYIFVNDKVDVLKHGVLSDKFDRGYPSDHLPVLSEVFIN